MPARSDGLGGWEDRPGGGAKIAPMKRKGAGSFPRADHVPNFPIFWDSWEDSLNGREG